MHQLWMMFGVRVVRDSKNLACAVICSSSPPTTFKNVGTIVSSPVCKSLKGGKVHHC